MKIIITAICGFATGLINIILLPLDSLISSYLPSLVYPLSQVAYFFSWLVQFVNWALSWLPLSTDTWSFIITVLIFRLTVPLAIDTIKLIVKWWHYLVP